MATARVCKFQKERKQLSYDCEQTWVDTSESRVIQGRDPVERNSPDCGYGGELKRTVVSGTACNGYDKFQAVYDEVSYDQGQTWNIVESSKRFGNLIERFSSDCCQLRTVSGVVCTSTFEKANANIQEASLDGEIWVQTGRYTITSIISGGVFDCMAQYNVKYLGVPYTAEEASNLEIYQKTNGNKNYNCWNKGATRYDGTSTNGYDVIGCPNGGYSPNVYTLWIKGSITNIKSISQLKSQILTDHNPTFTHELLNVNTNIKEIYVSSCASNPFTNIGMSCLVNLKKVHFAPHVSGTLGWGTVSSTNPSSSSGSGSKLWSFVEELEGLENTNITGVALDAFSHCNHLKSVHLPKTCSYLHGYCFSGCTSLSSVTIDAYVIDSDTGDGNWYYGQFENCPNLKEVTFTNLVRGTIPLHCFSSCSSLSSLTLNNPSGIDNYAFSNCSSLTTVDLGSNISRIGSGAFAGCSSLTDVYIRTSANILSNVYSGSFPSRTRIHVPCKAWGYWYKAYHIDHNIGNEIVPLDEDCFTVEWRAADINSEYTCVGYDKHYKEYKYVSTDSGATWYKTNETRAGALYEENSVDCGYVPVNYTVKYTFSNGNTSAITNTTIIEAYDYGYQVVSVEIGNLATKINMNAFKDFSECTNFVVPSDNIISEVFGGSGLFYNFGKTTNIITLDLRNLTALTSVGAADFWNCHANVIFPSTLASMNGSSSHPCFKSWTPDIQYVVTFTSSTPPTVYNSQYIFTLGGSTSEYQKYLVRVPSGSASAYETAFSGSLSRIIIEEY